MQRVRRFPVLSAVRQNLCVQTWYLMLEVQASVCYRIHDLMRFAVASHEYYLLTYQRNLYPWKAKLFLFPLFKGAVLLHFAHIYLVRHLFNLPLLLGKHSFMYCPPKRVLRIELDLFQNSSLYGITTLNSFCVAICQTFCSEGVWRFSLRTALLHVWEVSWCEKPNIE